MAIRFRSALPQARAKQAGAVPVPKSPTPPAPLSNPYLRTPREDVAAALLKAVMADDIGTLNLIHDIYPDCAGWMINGGGWIGGAPFQVPIVFHAVLGDGHALKWLIAHGADLTAESNIAISPAAAFAASKGSAGATVTLLQKMGLNDMAVTCGSQHFAHLSDVAEHYGHASLARALRHYRGVEDMPVPTMTAPAPPRIKPPKKILRL